jgi:hypothetical protein
VVVAVVTVRVVQVAVDQIVDMVAMRHYLVTATRAMLVPGLVSLAAVLRRAAVGVRCRYVDYVLVDVVSVRMVQVAVVQVVDMIAVAHRRVTAVRAVRMRVVSVVRFLARRHGGLPAFVIGVKLRRFGANGHV